MWRKIQIPRRNFRQLPGVISMRKIIVPIGLPGAGKTHFYFSNKSVLGTRVDMDVYIGSSLIEALTEVLKTPGDLYLDGLFLTEVSHNIIKAADKSKVYFYYFNTPRMICEYRDDDRVREGKRDKTSTATIQNARINLPKGYKNVL